MSKTRSATIAGGTLACALAVGHVMQIAGGPSAAALRVSEAPGSLERVMSMSVAPGFEGGAWMNRAGELELGDITLTSALPDMPVSRRMPAPLPDAPLATVSLSDMPIAEMPAEEPAPNFSCDYAMEATPVAAAMVTLSLSVPCMPGERFTIHHNGMMFSGVTDISGEAKMQVPALSEKPVFIASFANGDGAVASARLTTLEYYDRIVVQWKGAAALHLHALEYGAAYGDEGHVWAGAPRGMATGARGEGGFLTRLGDTASPDAMVAEVYTFPSGTARSDGQVAVRVEAEVTRETCGRDIEAQTIEARGGSALSVRDLVLSMPACKAEGDFLVLKNLVGDLKIARN